MQHYFFEVSDAVCGLLTGDEVANLSFAGEDSDFVRFNKGAVRQAGHVLQREVSLDLISGQRHAQGMISLAGRLDEDRPRLQLLVAELRDQRAHVPDDPYLNYATEGQSGERVMTSALPGREEGIDRIQTAARGRDLVGIYASGGVHSGFASSLGQRNWYSNYSFNVDWSFYFEKDKAVKTGYAGFEWDQQEFERKVGWATEQLAVLVHPARSIDPGSYRAYLAPAAIQEMIQLMSWGGFGLKAHETRVTPLLRLVTGDAQLDQRVSLAENTVEGVAPNFQESGFIRPDSVSLIESGKYRDTLVSPRSAKEYGVATNGAADDESPLSVDMAGGGLALDSVLEEIGTGLFVNNLWYLNFSDRAACRTTGMTRFATFWVEGGQIQAPLNVMRFDESLLQLFGGKLVELTSERDMLLDPSTYDRRSTASSRLPGALVDDFTLTL